MSTRRNEIVIALSAVALLALLFAWEYYRTRGPSFAPLNEAGTLDIPLSLSGGGLKLSMTTCSGDVTVDALVDTGSGEVLVADHDACVKVGAASQAVFASETAKIYPSLEPLKVQLGARGYGVRAKVLFATSGFSVLGLWPNNSASIRSFQISYDGHSGGYLTVPAPQPRSGAITLPYTIQHGFYVLSVKVRQGSSGTLRSMRMIVDSGSTDIFVSPTKTMQVGTPLHIESADGHVLGAQLSPVAKALGGPKFISMLNSMNAFIAGLPLFAGRRVSFDQSRQTVTFEPL